ncbi:MAG: hypothetical protein IID03_11100, partial [Candidatus Dadabacteria bacterium]|nr:hypothetical protein [Candidatus Dadabacteria bacterium]
LPSPGAAAALMGLVVFHQDLLPDVLTDIAPTYRATTGAVVAFLLPPVAMMLGLLMVSRLPYLHVVNQLFRGRRPFGQLVVIGILVLVGLVVWAVTFSSVPPLGDVAVVWKCLESESKCSAPPLLTR